MATKTMTGTEQLLLFFYTTLLHKTMRSLLLVRKKGERKKKERKKGEKKRKERKKKRKEKKRKEKREKERKEKEKKRKEKKKKKEGGVPELLFMSVHTYFRFCPDLQQLPHQASDCAT